MSALVLKLAGPLQSWGSSSRFTERKTGHEPTKSGIVGLLAAALGRHREAPIDDLACLSMAVRIDQQGRYERDFQTAHTRVFNPKANRWEAEGKSLPLSNRYYLADAVFVVAIEVSDEMLDKLAEALVHPQFPLYLGRRSCSPAGRILLAKHQDLTMEQALAQTPWQATNRTLKAESKGCESVVCEVVSDVKGDEPDNALVEYVQDVPLSFSVEHRMYGWRKTVRSNVQVVNPHFEKDLVSGKHDPMALFEEVS